MGIDLKILASNFRERRGELLSTASLRMDRDPRILSLFSQQADPCIVQALPEGLKVGHYEDHGLQFDDKDRHGRQLTFTTSDKLRALPKIEELSVLPEIDRISQWNRAALAFLLALPPDTKIVLYWC